jgi:hypothetical protein
MALIWTDAKGARRLLAGLGLAGAAAGVLAPAMTSAPALAAAGLALALVTAGWLCRGGRAPSLARLAYALVGGGLAGLVGQVAPPGVGYALLGWVAGACLTSPDRSWRQAVAGGLPAATGALALAIAAGLLQTTAAVSAWSVTSQAALLGGLLGLGVGAGELARALVVAREDPPAWIAELLNDCGAEGRPVLAAAIDGHRRVVQGVTSAQRLDAWDRRQALTRAADLLEATAKAVEALDAATRATLDLGRDAGSLEGHPELLAARAKIRASLEEQRGRARSEAGLRAADLTHMAAALARRRLTGPVTGLDLLTDLADREVCLPADAGALVELHAPDGPLAPPPVEPAASGSASPARPAVADTVEADEPEESVGSVAVPA